MKFSGVCLALFAATSLAEDPAGSLRWGKGTKTKKEGKSSHYIKSSHDIPSHHNADYQDHYLVSRKDRFYH